MTKRIIVCGGRNYSRQPLVDLVLSAVTDEGDVIVTGGAPGADSLAKAWAESHGRDVETHKAKWDLYGLGAGPIRNRFMASLGADKVVAFKGGAGTCDMVKVSFLHRIPVFLPCDNVPGIVISPQSWDQFESMLNPWTFASW